MSIKRERILELGENLIRTKGYNAFSYQDISSELGIKNAAIHYYFPTKENLGTSIVKTNFQRFEETITNMQSRKFDEKKQLETFIKIYIKSHREQKLCIIGSLGSDFYTLGESTRKELNRMTNFIIDWLTDVLKSGKDKKIFSFKSNPKDKAILIFSALVASLQISRIVNFNNHDYKHFCQSMIESLEII